MTDAKAVIDLLTAKKIPYEVLPHRAAFSAEEEAESLQLPRGEVLKTVVLDLDGGHAITVTPASQDLDMALVREAVGDRHAHLATEAEIARDFPAFELGSVPPLPSLAKVPVFVDPEIMLHPTVVFAEDQRESVRVSTADLFGGEYVTVTPLVKRGEQG